MATYMQESQFRTVPAGTAGIYRTNKQSSTYNPPVSYRKKYRTYQPCTRHTSQFRAIQAGTMRTGRYKKKVFFFFLSFVIFEFLLGQNDNLFALTY